MNAGGREAADTGGPFEPNGSLGDDSPTSEGMALPDPTADLVSVSSLAPPEFAGQVSSSSPTLPAAPARPPVPMLGPATSMPGASAWYRTDQQRYRSVYRRANPWYRRVARGVIGLSLLVVVGAGLYFGAQAAQDYLERDQLPKPGQATPTISSTTFLVTSSAPAPEINGTITLDTDTRAFEFVGAIGGPQSGLDVVSPDGAQVYVRNGGGDWQSADAGDADVDALMRSIPYLLGVDQADDVLENRLRKGYVTLIDATTEGVEPDDRKRYEMALDTQAYSTDYPLQWQAFQETVVPGIGEAAAVPVTMWLDDENVVVRVRDDQTHWSWERLAYSDQQFAALDPSIAVAP